MIWLNTWIRKGFIPGSPAQPCDAILLRKLAVLSRLTKMRSLSKTRGKMSRWISRSWNSRVASTVWSSHTRTLRLRLTSPSMTTQLSTVTSKAFATTLGSICSTTQPMTRPSLSSSEESIIARLRSKPPNLCRKAPDFHTVCWDQKISLNKPNWSTSNRVLIYEEKEARICSPTS